MNFVLSIFERPFYTGFTVHVVVLALPGQQTAETGFFKSQPIYCLHAQALRFMVGPDFKIWPIIFQGSGPSGPILFSCEKSHFNKRYSSYSESTNSIKQKVHVGCQYIKTCLKLPLKKKILITNSS